MVGRAYAQTNMGTAFTYQGFLENGTGPVTDTCDFRFGLWDAPAGGNQKGNSPQTASLVGVGNGVFTTPIDFGPGATDGTARWLEIEVQCPGDGGFTVLTPRTELTPAPYSIRAGEGVGGPNALNVTPSGDVGIGTTTPAAQLDVNGAARATTVEITGGSPLQGPLAGWGTGYATNVPAGTFTAVRAGDDHGLAIRSDGTLAGWGYNNYGQTNVPSGTFTALAAGRYHSLAIRSNGTLAGWGDNTYGQTDVPAGTFTAVAAGNGHEIAHCLAIRSDGTLVGWGDNTFGQISVPTGTFTAVAGGAVHSLAIRSDGTLVGWGSNDYGQTAVPSGTFTAVAAGALHSLAIRSDGTLVGWGHNTFGQTDVPSGTFTTVSAGNWHSLAIRSDGTLVGWGYNANGEINVPSGTFTDVSAGNTQSLAIRSGVLPPDPALRLHTDSAIKPGSNTWTIFSDRRLKKNIEPLSGALERLLQLRGVTFQWLDPAAQGGITGTQMGLIADEVQRAFPQWVGRDPKGYQTLTVGGFEALTAEALRELRAEKDCEIEDLKSEISDLKEGREIENLKSEISDLKEGREIENLKSEISDIKEMVKALTAKQSGGGR